MEVQTYTKRSFRFVAEGGTIRRVQQEEVREIGTGQSWDPVPLNLRISAAQARKEAEQNLERIQKLSAMRAEERAAQAALQEKGTTFRPIGPPIYPAVLKTLLRACDLSINEVARLTGISRGYIQRMTKFPSAGKRTYELADFLTEYAKRKREDAQSTGR